LPDANTYWALLWNPLFPFSLTLMVLTIFWCDRGTREGCKKDLWLSGLASGVMALLHPYSQPLLFALVGLMAVVRQRTAAVGYLARFCATALPFCLWMAWISYFVPIVSQHSAAGAMKSRAVGSYLLGFGLPLLLAAAGCALGRTQFFKRYWQLLAWFTLSFLCAYAPVWFQRKFIFGAHVPLGILAGVSVELLLARIPKPEARKWATVAAAVVLVPVLVSTQVFDLITYNKDVKKMLVEAREANPYYLSGDLAEGLRFLREKSNPKSVVLATPGTSTLIPAFSGNTVLWGHWAMSVDMKERQRWFESVCSRRSPWSDEQRCSEFWKAGIEYIFADGPFAASLRASVWPWNLILKDCDKVFENRSVVIFKHHGSGQPAAH
jgi:hypothetical protein